MAHPDGAAVTIPDLFRPKTIGEVASAWNRRRSDELLAESLWMRMLGFEKWANEVHLFAVIADRAASAEEYNPQPEGLPDERAAS